MVVLLRPCPFCRGEAELRIVGIGSYETAREVCCRTCGCRTNYYDEPQEAIDEWNIRDE